MVSLKLNEQSLASITKQTHVPVTKPLEAAWNPKIWIKKKHHSTFTSVTLLEIYGTCHESDLIQKPIEVPEIRGHFEGAVPQLWSRPVGIISNFRRVGCERELMSRKIRNKMVLPCCAIHIGEL
jgi:hypothetical protein